LKAGTEEQTGIQSQHYGSDYDYVSESPHLRHGPLNGFLTGLLLSALPKTDDRAAGVPPQVLEIGGGDGSISERLLEAGCDVTATEMSAESVERMDQRLGSHQRFRAILDEQGDLAPIAGRQFDLIVFASVLHHIPDYLSAVRGATDRFLLPRGSLVSLQDPLWYPRLGKGVRLLTEASYLSWRVTRGNLVRGLTTRGQRLLNGVSEDAPGDSVEYHMVRDGVDEVALSNMLEERFAEVTTVSYWSSQGVLQQRLGQRLGVVNTFAIKATGRRPGADA
jgi:SAM-dependent methyltransferase